MKLRVKARSLWSTVAGSKSDGRPRDVLSRWRPRAGLIRLHPDILLLPAIEGLLTDPSLCHCHAQTSPTSRPTRLSLRIWHVHIKTGCVTRTVFEVCHFMVRPSTSALFLRGPFFWPKFLHNLRGDGSDYLRNYQYLQIFCKLGEYFTFLMHKVICHRYGYLGE